MAEKQYDNNMSGTLFRNKNPKDDKSPEYNGSAEIDGVQYWVNAWVKTCGEKSKRPGEKFFSMSFQQKDDTGGKPKSKPAPAATDDIPF